MNPSSPSTADGGLVIAVHLTQGLQLFIMTLSVMAGIYMIGSAALDPHWSLYAFTFFQLGNLLGLPLGRYCTERCGARWGLVLCLCGLALSCLGCALSDGWAHIVAWRFAQGCFCGPCTALLAYLTQHALSPKARDAASSRGLALAVTIPALGAAWGGVDAYYLSWRLIYYEAAFIALALAAYFATLSRSSRWGPSSMPAPIDWKGYLLYVISVGGLCTALILGQWMDWHRSHLILLLLASSAVALPFLLARHWEVKAPILRLDVWKHRHLAYSYLMVVALYFAYFGTITTLPQWLFFSVQFTPAWVGAILAPMFFTAQIPFLLRKQLARLDLRLVLASALVFLALSCLYTATFNSEVDLFRLVISRVLAGFSLALFLPPLQRLAFTQMIEVEPSQTLVWFSMSRSLGGLLGGSLLPTLWLRRQDFYHSRLGEALTQAAPLTQHFLHKIEQVGPTGLQPVALLQEELNRQSTALALNDVFLFTGAFLLLLLATLPIIHWRRPAVCLEG